MPTPQSFPNRTRDSRRMPQCTPANVAAPPHQNDHVNRDALQDLLRTQGNKRMLGRLHALEAERAWPYGSPAPAADTTKAVCLYTGAPSGAPHHQAEQGRTIDGCCLMRTATFLQYSAIALKESDRFLETLILSFYLSMYSASRHALSQTNRYTPQRFPVMVKR